MESADYDFVDLVPDRLICSICTKVLTDPHLVVCCGQKFCASCLQIWLETMPTPTCPHCRAKDEGEWPFQHVIDRGMKREIESLHIMCCNHKKGCKWTGEMRDLKEHLQSDRGCDYAMITCPNRCQVATNGCTKLMRKNVPYHLEHLCEYRKTKCQYCGYISTEKGHSSHQLTCKLFPMECSNYCEEVDLDRHGIDTHWQTCRFELVSCEYAHVGCEKVRRQDKTQHMATCQGQHLEMMKEHNEKLREEIERMKQELLSRASIVDFELKLAEQKYGNLQENDLIRSLKTQFQTHRNIMDGEWIFRMLKYKQIMNKEVEWRSPEFHLGDYIMYLHVKGHDNKIQFQLWLKKPKINCLNFLCRSATNVPSRIEVGIKHPSPKLSEQQSSHSQLQRITSLTCCFDFEPSFHSIGNRVSDKLLNSWTLSLSSKGEEIYVEDDSLVWTISAKSI